MNVLKWGTLIISIWAVVACGQQDSTNSTKEEVDSSATEIQRDTRETIAAIENFTIEQKDDLHRQVQNEISSLDDKLDDFQSEIENARNEAKSELNDLTADLNQKLQTVKSQADELKDASAESWEDAKASMIAALNDVKEAYNRAVAHVQ